MFFSMWLSLTRSLTLTLTYTIIHSLAYSFTLSFSFFLSLSLLFSFSLFLSLSFYHSLCQVVMLSNDAANLQFAKTEKLMASNSTLRKRESVWKSKIERMRGRESQRVFITHRYLSTLPPLTTRNLFNSSVLENNFYCLCFQCGITLCKS